MNCCMSAGNESLNTSSSSSSTEQLHQTLAFPLYVRVTVTLMCCLLMIVGVLGNLLVPLVVLSTRDLRTSTNTFLLNLSVVDLCMLVMCMPKVMIEVHTRPEVWTLGKLFCHLIPFTELMVAHVSVMTMMAITVERYYAICCPLRVGYVWTQTRALAVILAVWMLAILTASPLFWIVEFSTAEYLDNSLVPVCTTTASTTVTKLYFITKDLVFFVVPGVVLIILYAIITQHLIREPRVDKTVMRASRGRSPSVSTTCYSTTTSTAPAMRLREMAIHRSRKQVVLMLIAVIVCFFVCMLPSSCFRLFIILASDSVIMSLGWETYHNINFICRLLVYVNCSINPILYNVMSSKFRAAFRKALRLESGGTSTGASIVCRTTSDVRGTCPRSQRTSTAGTHLARGVGVQHETMPMTAMTACLGSSPSVPRMYGRQASVQTRGTLRYRAELLRSSSCVTSPSRLPREQVSTLSSAESSNPAVIDHITTNSTNMQTHETRGQGANSARATCQSGGNTDCIVSSQVLI